MRLPDQHHHRRNRARPSQHRDAHRHNPHIVLGGGCGGFAARFLRRGTLRRKHIEPNQQQNDTAGNLKRRKRDPEQTEDIRAGKGKGAKNDKRRQGGLAGSTNALGVVLAFGDGEKGGEGGKGVNEKEDRAKCKQRESNVDRPLQMRQSGGAGNKHNDLILSRRADAPKCINTRKSANHAQIRTQRLQPQRIILESEENVCRSKQPKISGTMAS